MVLERQVTLGCETTEVLRSRTSDTLFEALLLSDSLPYVAGLHGCTVHLDPSRCSIALRGSQDLCLVKKPQVPPGELLPQGALTFVYSRPPPAACQRTPSPCARRLAGKSRDRPGAAVFLLPSNPETLGLTCLVPLSLSPRQDLLPGPLVCPARVCHLPAPWHDVSVHSATNYAGWLCCCWVVLQSPVCGNLLHTIAPGAQQDLVFARSFPSSCTDDFHPEGQSSGNPCRCLTHVLLSWRC